MTSVLLDNIGELTTNDPSLGDGSRLGLVERAALVLEEGRVAWVGSAADAPAADEAFDVAGRRGHTGLRRQPCPSGIRRGPLCGVRRADGGHAVLGRRHPRPRSPRPGRLPMTCWRRTRPGSSPRWQRQGTTTVEIKSGYGLTAQDEARALAIASGFTPRDDIPRRPRRRAGVRRRPGRVRRPGDRPDAGSRAPARPMDRRLLRARCLRRGPGALDPPCRAWRPASLRGSTRTSSGRGRGSRWRARSGPPRPTTARTLTGSDVERPTSRRRRGHPPSRRRVLHPFAVPRRARAARRRRHRGARQRLQPGVVLLVVDAAVHRVGRARDADVTGRGAVVSDRRRGGGAAPYRRGAARAGRGPTSACWRRRRTCTWPTGPACPSSAPSSPPVAASSDPPSTGRKRRVEWAQLSPRVGGDVVEWAQMPPRVGGDVVSTGVAAAS